MTHPKSINLDFSQSQVMAIVNVTPDSFYAASRTPQSAEIEQRIGQAVAQGASILDIGGYSSRPGAAEVSLSEEWERVARGLEAARRVAPETAVSLDTFRAEIIRRAVEMFGAVIVNDITAAEADPAMVAVVAQYDLPYIAMHMRGTPATMQSQTDYPRGVAAEVVDYFEAKTAQLLSAGIRRERIILDPGFGFSKTTEQNFELLAELPRLCALGFPVLAGVSRKSMIWRTLGVDPAQTLAGTVALGWECLRQGASILRVHDVQQAVDTVRLFQVYEQNRK